jgi:hypothetical protein
MAREAGRDGDHSDDAPGRLFLVAVALIATLGAFTWGAVVGERQADRYADLTTLLARIEALEQRAEAATKVRSISIITEKLDVSVYPVENVGVHKVRR